ncbi:MAG: hypothetical protein JXB32_13050 [Deltaproteobacteria bacterium]|nr:hypothetical protein [Deltaproteobacteria bacterium]
MVRTTGCGRAGRPAAWLVLGGLGLLPAGGCSETTVDAIVAEDSFEAAAPDADGTEDAAGGCRPGVPEDCAAGERCEISGCDAASGRCTAVPAICDATWDPQCGCDGRTYWNTCELLGAGLARRYGGACADEECGPFPGGTCPSGLLCATVGCAPGTPGVCAVPPASCGTDAAPACACNDASYPDVCELFRDARLPMNHAGACTPALCAPECRDLGGGDLAWVDSCSAATLCRTDCLDCTSFCGGIGRPGEGWYADCPPGRDAGCVDWNVIEWTLCGRP